MGYENLKYIPSDNIGIVIDLLYKILNEFKQTNVYLKSSPTTSTSGPITLNIKTPKYKNCSVLLDNQNPKCNCDKHNSGESTGGWYCPVHGQQL